MAIEGPSTDQLRERVSCAVLGPGDPGYDEARRSFNATIDRRPALIVQAQSVGDVVEAVRMGAADSLPIAVRGGGHSVAGHSMADDALVVDLSQMRNMVVNPERRVAHVDGGAQWLDVDSAAFAHGLGTTGGTFGDTGVGGLALSGGLGWLMGIGGLTCDNVVGTQVVTADGDVVEVDAEREPELLWALRGGGGNFGVVTRFDLALYPIGEMYGGYLFYAPEHAATVLQVVRDLMASAPDELVIAPIMGRRMQGPATGLVLAAELCFLGPPEAAEAALGPLRAAAPVLAETLRPMTYLGMQAFGELPFGLRHHWKGHFVRELPDALIHDLVDYFVEQPPILGGFLFEPLHGRVKRVPDESAAFGQRTAAFNISALSVWDDPSRDAEGAAWARRGAEILAPYSLTGGGYLNYATDEPAERVRAAFGEERFARLVEVKRRYDPDNRFRFNHNIPPD